MCFNAYEDRKRFMKWRLDDIVHNLEGILDEWKCLGLPQDQDLIKHFKNENTQFRKNWLTSCEQFGKLLKQKMFVSII